MHKQDATQGKLNPPGNVKCQWLGDEIVEVKICEMKYRVQDGD